MNKLVVMSMLLILAACSSPSIQDNNAFAARKVFEAFNKHDWKVMTSLYAEQALFLDPSFGKEFVSKSRSETVAKYAEMEKMFPDIHDEVTGLYASENTITVEFISTGTAPDGTKFVLPIVSVLTFKEGLIIKDATYYDL
jgi:ketosteroid isomerase-like protein